MIAVLIVALISATISTGCSPIENSNFMKGQKFLEQDEIIEIFEENKEHFISVKNSMSDFRYSWAICKSRSIGSGWKVCALGKGLYLGIGELEYFKQSNVIKKTAQDEDSIEYILKELGFRKIAYSGYADAKHISFTKHASTGDVAGILYCIEGGPESEVYANIIVDLGDGWYYYATR